MRASVYLSSVFLGGGGGGDGLLTLSGLIVSPSRTRAVRVGFLPFDIFQSFLGGGGGAGGLTALAGFGVNPRYEVDPFF